MERTLVILKPGCLQRGLIGAPVPNFLRGIARKSRRLANANGILNIELTGSAENTVDLLFFYQIYKTIDVLFRMMGLWSNTGYAEPQYTEEAVVDEDFDAEHAPVDESGARVKDAGDKRKATQKTVATALIGASAIGSAVISLLANNLY